MEKQQCSVTQLTQMEYSCPTLVRSPGSFSWLDSRASLNDSTHTCFVARTHVFSNTRTSDLIWSHWQYTVSKVNSGVHPVFISDMTQTWTWTRTQTLKTWKWLKNTGLDYNTFKAKFFFFIKSSIVTYVVLRAKVVYNIPPTQNLLSDAWLK